MTQHRAAWLPASPAQPHTPAARCGSPAPGMLAPEDDAARWRAAGRLHDDHPGWLVLWLARLGQFRAYRVSGRARRAVTLTASDPAALAAQITAAEKTPDCPAANDSPP